MGENMATNNQSTRTSEVAILAGGCFWCLEAVFRQVRGVSLVESGYCGGEQTEPDYESVCRGETGHAEAVRLTFDPAEISYPELLTIFFAIHDPTTLNRQGNDVGSQYRSAIFYQSAAQHEQALLAAQQTTDQLGVPVVTQIVPAAAFWPAEAYHQRYFEQHAAQPYCAVVVAPKVRHFLRDFPAYVKSLI